MTKKLSRILSSAVLLCALACQKNPDSVRDEYIRFYSSRNMSKEINVLQIPFEGESAKLYIKTNADVVVKFEPQMDSWITFEEPVKISDGEYEVAYTASGLVDDLDQRTASVNVTSTAIWLGKFLKVCQGYKFLWSPESADAPKTITYAKPWDGKKITGINKLSNAYISFNAYATIDQTLYEGQTFQLRITLSEGAEFTYNGLKSYVVDVAKDTGAKWANLVALPFMASASTFAENTKVSLSLVSDIAGLSMSIKNLKIYNVTEDLLGGGDGEEWGDFEGDGMEDLE